MVVSYHVPLLMSCRNLTTMPRSQKLETFWFRYEVPKHMVQMLWEQDTSSSQDKLSSFHSKTQLLHKSLSLWHKEGFGEMDKQLQYCKKAVLFFDKIEEKRPLAQHEFQLRCRIKERSYELANNLEERWRQRSSNNWIKQGDRNTRYFHACASARVRINRVTTIQHEGLQETDQTRILSIFAQQMREVLGESAQVVHFEPSALYGPSQELSGLDIPFTLHEIEVAVMGLSENKASGPDGIPAKFLQVYWPSLKDEIMHIMRGFYENQLNLEEFNKANVVMLPKGENPLTVKEFRPISIINIISKLISKVLANRLRLLLPTLIFPNHTTFMSSLISQNCIY